MTRGGESMQEFDHDIQPGVGVGPLLLGTSMERVREILGKPDVVDKPGRGNETDQFWRYDRLQLDLGFMEDEDLRLGLITSFSSEATLRGSPIVGLGEDLLRIHDYEGLGPPTLADDFQESGRDYEWDEANLSCWVRFEDSTVESVTVMPLYDESGNVPRWPGESEDVTASG